MVGWIDSPGGDASGRSAEAEENEVANACPRQRGHRCFPCRSTGICLRASRTRDEWIPLPIGGGLGLGLVEREGEGRKF